MLCCRLSPLTASHPQDGAGNAFAAPAAPVWRLETRRGPATRRPPLRGRHLGRPLAAVTVTGHPISGPCRVRIHLSVPPILLTAPATSAFSACPCRGQLDLNSPDWRDPCYPGGTDHGRRSAGLPSAPSRRSVCIDSATRAPGAGRPAPRVTGRIAVGRAGSFNLRRDSGRT